MSATEDEAWAAREFPFAVSWQLRSRREQLGWTLAQTVERLGNTVSISTLHRYESTQRNIPLPQLWEICTMLGLDVVKVIADAVAAVGPTSRLPCPGCKGAGVAFPLPSALVDATASPGQPLADVESWVRVDDGHTRAAAAREPGSDHPRVAGCAAMSG